MVKGLFTEITKFAGANKGAEPKASDFFVTKTLPNTCTMAEIGAVKSARAVKYPLLFKGFLGEITGPKALILNSLHIRTSALGRLLGEAGFAQVGSYRGRNGTVYTYLRNV